MHHDPKIWGDDVDEFKPERFLNADGHFVKREELIAFSFGKRSCPGESLAVVELFLYTTYILQKYRLALPPGVVADFTQTLGITAQPKTPVTLTFELRR